MKHKHKAKTTRTQCWTGCVAPHGCSGAAHGGVTFVSFCTCGAERRVESNGCHRRSSGWYEPELPVCEECHRGGSGAGDPVCAQCPTAARREP